MQEALSVARAAHAACSEPRGSGFRGAAVKFSYLPPPSCLLHLPLDRTTCGALQRGNRFADISIRARQAIAELGARFIRNGSTLLTHGRSRVVLALLQRAVSQVGCRQSKTTPMGGVALALFAVGQATTPACRCRDRQRSIQRHQAVCIPPESPPLRLCMHATSSTPPRTTPLPPPK